MPQSGTGERVTPVLDFPSRDGLSVQAIRVDYEPGGFARGTHRHPAAAYVYVIDGRPDRVLRARRRRTRDRLSHPAFTP
jgi:quercetin dioxygenase-like cupin family protein